MVDRGIVRLGAPGWFMASSRVVCLPHRLFCLLISIVPFSYSKSKLQYFPKSTYCWLPLSPTSSRRLHHVLFFERFSLNSHYPCYCYHSQHKFKKEKAQEMRRFKNIRQQNEKKTQKRISGTFTMANYRPLGTHQP